MAGSWEHMTNRNARLHPPEVFHDLVEQNTGDVYEAAEHCFGMVWWLAAQLAQARGQTASRANALPLVRQASANWKTGIAIGGRAQAPPRRAPQVPLGIGQLLPRTFPR